MERSTYDAVGGDLGRVEIEGELHAGEGGRGEDESYEDWERGKMHCEGFESVIWNTEAALMLFGSAKKKNKGPVYLTL